MRHAYFLLDVFTDRPYGGNPLAVFPDGTSLATDQMQCIARELNLSESVFVLPPETERGTRRVRIFTPLVEMPFAGHPTVGTACLLAELDPGLGSEIVLEEGVGPIEVRVRRGDDARAPYGELTAAQPPEWGPPPPAGKELAAMLGVTPEQIGAGALKPESVSCGLPFLVVPLADVQALASIRFDTGRWAGILADAWAPHVYAIAPVESEDGIDFRARMFGPAVGVPEDPATGSAAAALAGYLARHAGAEDVALEWLVEQGVEMGRPSRLALGADFQGGEVRAVRVGGHSVVVGEGSLEAPGGLP